MMRFLACLGCVILFALLLGCGSSNDTGGDDPAGNTGGGATASNTGGSDTGGGNTDAGECENLVEEIRQIAKRIEAKNYPYVKEQGTDCSGIFHKALDQLQQTCPEMQRPTFETDRDSRDIAAWYAGRKMLDVVEDPLAQDSAIRPGAVMFYSDKDVYGKMRAGAELDFQDISHVGIVYEVTRDESSGEVLRYTLFHGQRPGKTAGVTSAFSRKPNEDFRSSPGNLTPFGNWSDQWVAVATLTGPAG